MASVDSRTLSDAVGDESGRMIFCTLGPCVADCGFGNAFERHVPHPTTCVAAVRRVLHLINSGMGRLAGEWARSCGGPPCPVVVGRGCCCSSGTFLTRPRRLPPCRRGRARLLLLERHVPHPTACVVAVRHVVHLINSGMGRVAGDRVARGRGRADGELGALTAIPPGSSDPAGPRRHRSVRSPIRGH